MIGISRGKNETRPKNQQASSPPFTLLILVIIMATPTETNTPTIKAILFDMDGTLLDTEALSDKAILLAFGTSLPAKVLEEPPMSSYSVPWELKKQVLGLRGAEWVPLVLDYAKKNWMLQKK